MKKLLFVASVLLALAASGQFKKNLPGSVQQYYLERSAFENMNGLTIKSSFSNWSGPRPSFAQPRMVDGTEMIDAFIDIANSEVIPLLKAAGVKVNCEFKGFVTAQIPMHQLEQIHLIPGVTNVEISRVVELCSDSTLRVTHAGQVLKGKEYGLPRMYDGTGVVIGIIDYGFDFQHIAFKKADGVTNRIKRVYNTADTTGHPVIIGGNQVAGSVFMGAQLDTMTTDDPSGYHGTHTSCLAAGTHYNGYGGMAPGADIVMCAPATFKWGFLESEVVNCIKYIFSYADSVNKPCVISMSVSTSFGSHDGNDRVSKAVSQLVGPGRVFVIAAGNNATKYQYSFGPATETDNRMNMLLGCYSTSYNHGYYYDHLQIDSWARAKSTRPINQFFIFDKQTQRIVWRSEYCNLYQQIDASEISDYYESGSSGDGYLEAMVALNPNNNKFCLSSTIHNLRSKSYTVDADGYRTSRYQIGVAVFPPHVMNPRQPDSCYIDSWMYTGNGQRTRYSGVVYVDEVTENGDTVTRAVSDYFSAPSDMASIGTYAVADSIISAGGFVARNYYYSYNLGTTTWNDSYVIGSFYKTTSFEGLGYGPTGKALPTVMAPGFDVVSAVSRYNNYAVNGPSTVLRLPGNHNYAVLTGTSMAAPTVAGIIAEWLQINPNLSPGDIKKVIAATAIKDEFTMSAIDGARYGPNGKIDAMAGALYILERSVHFGDVNNDGAIDVVDMTLMIDCLLNGIDFVIGDGFYVNEPALDINMDGTFNVVDISYAIDFILGRID